MLLQVLMKKKNIVKTRTKFMDKINNFITKSEI